ncbi:PQQ-binding-like beta-propeller repeat protein, partial [Streptomyces sp. F8]
PRAPRGRRARIAVGAGLGLLLVGGTVGGYLRYGPAAGSAPAQIAGKADPAPAKTFAPWSVPLGKAGTGSRIGACSWQAEALYCAGPGLTAARLDPADGSTVWSVEAAAGSPAKGTPTPGAPLHAGGRVLVVAPGSETLQALDPATGAERWRHRLPAGSQAVPAGGQVLVVGTNGSVTALDAATGTPRWTRQIGGVGSVWWTGGGTDGGAAPDLYVATPDGSGSTQLASVDPASGTVTRQFRTTGRLRPVGAAHGGLYLVDVDASSRTTGVVRADLTARTAQRVRLTAPLFDAEAAVDRDGVAYLFGTSGTLVAVGAGQERWRLETGVTVASRPVVADGRVHLTAPDGRLLAVDAGGGRPAGQTRPRMADGKDTYASTLPAPVSGGGRMFAGAPDGSVFAVDGSDPARW